MKRLDVAVSFLGDLTINVLADIGCDHGLLAKKVLDFGICHNIICSDISAKSLEKARKLLSDYNFADNNVQFVVGDGFECLPQNVDTAVIMGMGGHEIVKIIKSRKNSALNLVLSPHNFAGLVRHTLVSIGYDIIRDVVTLDGRKFYDIIVAVRTDLLDATDDLSSQRSLGEGELDGNLKGEVLKRGRILTETEAEWGVFYKERDEVLLRKLLKTEAKLKSYKPTMQNLDKLKMISEVKKWQQ